MTPTRSRPQKGKCCKNPKNWKDYYCFPDDNGEPYVNYGCIKCDKIYGMNYQKYINILRKTFPNRRILA